MYATVEDIEKRCKRTFNETETAACNALLEDAETIIEAYSTNVADKNKKLVICNMVVRAIGDGEGQVPIGATQGTVSALGYSQTWTMSGGSSGELYLTKLDKKLLGLNRRSGYINTLEGDLDD